MADGTTISWTDATWNPLLGCERVSAGCDGCYAIPGSHMRASNPNPKIAAAYAGLTHRTDGRTDWTGKVNLLADRLTQPLKWRKPRRIFVNSMSDLFHEQVEVDFIARVFAVMSLAEQHIFQMLTKRHGRMRHLLNEPDFVALVDDHRERIRPGCGDFIWPLPNLHLGVSVEDQRWADIRIPALLATPAAIRWISAEPLLGPIDLLGLLDRHGGRPRLTYWLHGRPGAGPAETTSTGLEMRPLTVGPRLDWIVVGGESGHGARPMHPGWARSLREQCTTAGVAFHFKQWGEWGPAPFVVRVCDPKVGWTGTAEELVEAKRAAEAKGATHVHTGNWYVKDGRTAYHIHEIGHPCWGLERAELPDDHMAPIRRWGKSAAGRELDGEIWDEYPAVTR